MTRLSFAIGLLTAFAAAPCFGQSSTSMADIPFSFEVGKVSLPAGTYLLTGSNSFMTIRSAKGSPAMFVATSPLSTGDSSDKRVLRFHVYGDRHFLSEVWTGYGAGRSIRLSSYEREVARNFTPGAKNDQTLALNRASNKSMH